jgi:hypothetical protein
MNDQTKDELYALLERLAESLAKDDTLADYGKDQLTQHIEAVQEYLQDSLK